MKVNKKYKENERGSRGFLGYSCIVFNPQKEWMLRSVWKHWCVSIWYTAVGVNTHQISTLYFFFFFIGSTEHSVEEKTNLWKGDRKNND